jgi:hypothetical protein
VCQTPEEELTRLVQSYQIPYTYRWYNPEKKYVKIETNKDKIYFLLADSIISTEGYFSGKLHKYLHLLHKGNEVPIYISSADEYFNSGDTIFFVGSRAVGDTTFLDPFSNYESFFLTYDENTEGHRLSKINFPASSQKMLDYLPVKYHFEEHHQYSIGQPEVSSQTVNGEGWVWELLSPYDEYIKQSKFVVTRSLLPNQNFDSVTFRFFAFSSKFDSTYTKHNIAILINGDTAYSNIFPPGKNIIIDFKYPANKLLLGDNEFEIINKGTYKKAGELALPDVIGFQYLEYQAKDYPFAKNGFASFNIPPEMSNSTLEIHNFINSTITLVDTTSKGISFLRATPSITFWVNAFNKNLRIFVNDSVFTSNQKGLHIVVFDSISKNIKYNFYTEESDKAIGDIKNLPSNSVYIAVFNGTNINNKLEIFFEDEGSEKVDKAKNGTSWIFAKKIGTQEKYETYGSIQNIALAGSFNCQYSNRYTLSFNLPAVESQRHFYVSDEFSLEQPKLKAVQSSNLYDTTLQADVIVIAPKIFKEVAEKYITYRKSTEPDKTFYIALTEDIYKEFNYGKKSPESIKRFLVWAYYKWKKPRVNYVVIIGDANFDTRNVLSESVYKDYVPTFGWPPTDMWYAFLEGNDFVPDIHLGRIPIKNIQEGLAYLQKIEEYDKALTAPWMKKFLFLSGGINQLERDYFYDRLKGDFADYILGLSPICVQTQVIRKSDEIVGSEADASLIRSAINNGVMFMLFAGHGSAKVFDTDGWKVQTLNNKGKYGFFSSFSCNTANFAEPSLVSRNEEYALFPDKGFVGTLGSGGVSVRLNSLILATNLLTLIADSNIKTDYMIELIDLAKERQIKSSMDLFNILTVYHYVYLGDPLLRLKIRRKPDLYFIDNKVDIVNEFGKQNFTQSDSLFVINGQIGNIGFSKKDYYYLWVIHTYNGKSDTLKRIINELCSLTEFQFKLPVEKRVGLHNFKILINPEQKLEEYDFSNNVLSYDVEVFASTLYPVDPLSNWNVHQQNPLFRFVDPNFDPSRDTYKFRIYSHSDTTSQLIYGSNANEISTSKLYIDWNPRVNLPSGDYWLFAQKSTFDTLIKNQSLWLPFNTETSTTDSSSLVVFSKKEHFDNSNFTLQNLEYNDSTRSIRFKPFKIPYKIMSCTGNERSERGKEITVNDKVYVTMAPDLDIVGFHVVLISHTDFSLKTYKIFETWGTEPPEIDSSSIKLIQFLRDSVPDRDYIFLVTHNSALRVPIAHQLANPRSPGSLDSLREALREWGSKYADSLGLDINRYGNSYFMVGRNFKGRKILIDEGFNLYGDTVESDGFLVQYPSTAKIITPALGPSKHWMNFKINDKINDSTITSSTKVFGITVPYGKQKDLLEKYDNSNSIELSKPLFDMYPYLQFEISYSNPDESPELSIDEISSEFVPTPELAINLEKPTNKNIDTLRGEEINYSFSVYNLSPRVGSDSIWIYLNEKSSSKDIVYTTHNIKSLRKNSSYKVDGNIITDNFDNQTKIVFQAQQQLPELYSFNNTDMLNFNIKEDSEKPTIVLYLDGMKISGGEYVSKQPKVYIEILDNSRLPIDTNDVTLLLNVKNYALGRDAQFVGYGKNVPLKCTFELQSDELEYGLNYFTIYATDRTGNKDTLDVPVYVARSAKIQNYTIGPNPTPNGVTFYIKYISPKLDATVFVDIYDIVGNKIQTLSKKIKLNEDYIYWDGLDSTGRSTPQGVYFFKITVVGEIYSEPVFGKLVKIQ